MSAGYDIHFTLNPAIPGTIIGIFDIIYIPLLIYYLNEFLKYKGLIYVSKRYPSVTRCEIIFVILVIGVTFNIIILYRSIEENSKIYKLLWDITIFSQPITLYGCFYCLLWRCWHFYYDMMLNVHLENQWKTIINPNAELSQQSWFLNHKSSFGSTKYIFKRVLFMYIVSCFISIGIWFIDDFVGYFIAALTDFFVFSGYYSYAHLHSEYHLKTLNKCTHKKCCLPNMNKIE